LKVCSLPHVTIKERVSAPTGDRPGGGSFGRTVILWAFAIVLLQGVLWVSGFRGLELTRAVETGTARVEADGQGALGDDAIREAILTQRETLPFWATLVALGDFVVEPMLPMLRAAIAAILFSGLAAVRGRPIRFDETVADCAWVQGFWVLGLATRVGLTLALDRPEAETSATLLLPPGTHLALLWAGLQQVDAFALLGWAALAMGARRRDQAGWPTATLLCGGLWALESSVRFAMVLVIGGGMRRSLLPG